MKVTLNDVEATSFDLVPAARYMAFIADAEDKVSAAANDYVNVTLEIVSAGPAKGRKVWDVLSARTPGALSAMKGKVEAAGVKIPAGEFDVTAAIIGKPVVIVVKHKAQAGYDTKAEVSSWAPAEGGATTAADPLAGAPAPGAADDDIPF